MKHNNRRQFIQQSMASAAGLVALPEMALSASPKSPSIPITYTGATRMRFSVIGINHGHIYSMVKALLRNGGELISVYAVEPDLLAAFTKEFPQAKVARSQAEILDDKSIQLIASSAIPAERAVIGMAAMRHGKDVMVDKPGITSLEQLAEVKKVQRETKRIYSISYSERFENQATVKAGELVKAGAIGNVIQTIGLGPHRMTPKSRPEWFFDQKNYGGILCDIGSHQCDQFLYFTGSNTADVVAAQAGNVHYPQYPQFQDFGDLMLRGNGGMGYVRVDWFTPDGLSTWGDGRLTILGTDGYMELRKYVDIGGRTGGSHLFLVNQKETKHIDCSQEPLPYGGQLIDDVLNRTETAMTQAHCFLATELALKAQKKAEMIKLAK
ncbi:Gfo/Idh/MocA family protein [Fibrella aquatilis]|uniref:Gfo/Idh/MocA family oxidoreductase n=1 Tax=Fibrella aquatilis TaxID=2817059 RepID=A0A939G747_9BACT|nr:Gfo/Idh/MocA family oxidoreductase [Fibrella aquatilis]MBO0931251.1 Gfo/Idh/MocA family oxidoreductase [Fibrella aquatilis]